MIATLKFPTLLKFPLGGAQRELERVSRMFGGAFRKPFQSAFAAAATAAANPLASVPWVAQWKFNNNGLDSIGANNLTNNNSATFTTGKLGGATGATQLVSASSQWWSIPNNSDLQTGDVDFLVCFWIYLDSLTLTDHSWMGKIAATGAGGQAEYWLGGENPGGGFRFFFKVSPTGNFADRVTVYANNFGTPSLSTWYLVVAWHNSTDNTINICVNNGTPNSTSNPSGVMAGTSALGVGGIGNVSLLDSISGRIDAVGFAKFFGAVPTQAVLDALWNNGAGTETLT